MRARPLSIVALALLFAAGVVGCKEPRHKVDEVLLTGGTARDNGLLGLNVQQIAGRLEAALKESGRFELGVREGKTASLLLELPFTREAQKRGREGTWAEVGATLTVERKVEQVGYRYQVVGLGEAEVTSPEGRQRAMREALDHALAQVVEGADLQLKALGRSDEDLLRDLKDEDARIQEYALRVLSERGNPAVAEVLIARLKTARDLDQLRRAMGALAEMREKRAVKPLIELTRGKDPGFVREVIFALAQIGGEESMAWLFTMAQGHDDPGLREAAKKALAEVELRSRTQAAGR